MVNFFFRRKIEKYIFIKISIVFASIFFVLSLIIFGNQFLLVIKESVEQGYYSSDFFELTFLKYLRDIPFVLSLSFFLSILISLNNLYKSSEGFILNSSGYSDYDFFKIIVKPLTLLLIFLIFFIFYIEPINKSRIDLIKKQLSSSPEFSFFFENEFQEFNDGKTIFYSPFIKENENGEQEMKNIFLYESHGEPSIILASEGKKSSANKNLDFFLILNNGEKYSLTEDLNQIEDITKFEKFEILLNNKKSNKNNQSTIPLDENKKKSVLYWKISKLIILPILVFFALAIIQTNQRSLKNKSIIFGVLIFIFYYNTILFFRDLILSGDIMFTNALMVSHALFTILGFILYRVKNSI